MCPQGNAHTGVGRGKGVELAQGFGLPEGRIQLTLLLMKTGLLWLL